MLKLLKNLIHFHSLTFGILEQFIGIQRIMKNFWRMQKKELTLNLMNFGAMKNAAVAYFALERYDEALAQSEIMDSIFPKGTGLGIQGMVYAKQGQRAKALEVIEIFNNYGESYGSFVRGRIYTWLGDFDNAFKYYNMALDEPHFYHFSWWKYYPEYEVLKNDPRAAQLIEKMGVIF